MARKIDNIEELLKNMLQDEEIIDVIKDISYEKTNLIDNSEDFFDEIFLEKQEKEFFVPIKAYRSKNNKKRYLN